MSAGDLDQRITIQSPPVGQDETGEPLQVWADFAQTWAKVEDLSGRQYIAAQAAQNPVQAKIRIRHRPGVVATMRVLHGADVYDIQAVLKVEARWLDLMCVRGASNG
jgi:SPP1 family predicted phage head-tail adaptor